MFNKIKQLFEWLKTKWEWRGIATVTKEDWRKVNKRDLLSALRITPAFLQASDVLIDKLWPESRRDPYYLDVMEEPIKSPSEQTQEIIKELEKIRKIAEKLGDNAFILKLDEIIKYLRQKTNE